MKIYIKALACLFLFALYGCGFHLAGTGEFSNSLERTSVQGFAISRELLNQIKRNLKSNQIDVVNPEQATALVNVLSEETEKEVLTLDSDGKAREYELILKVSFDVKGTDNSYFLKPQEIQLSRDFVFDKRDLLGANEEEAQLFDEMKRDAAKLIVYRLQSIE